MGEMKRNREKKTVRSFTATLQELSMLEALARYHGFSKSGTITNLLKKEFWRVFPKGNGDIHPDPGAKISGETVVLGETVVGETATR